ncbi:unnamed protein product [Closterium sp. NIES-53]
MTTPPGSSNPDISGFPTADSDSALISAPVSAPPPVSTALVSAYALASAYAFISASTFACASALVSASATAEPSPLPAPATGSTSISTPTTGSGTTDSGTSSRSSSSDQSSSGGGSSRGAGAPPYAEHARIPLHHAENAPLSRVHMVHYVDISSLTSLRKHLQQPVPPAMPPFRLPNKPMPPILAYSATVPLSAPPLRPPGNSGAASAAAPAASAGPGLASAPSLAQQYRWKVDAALVVAAEGMMLEWLAEPRVGLLLDLQIIRRQLAYILGIDILAAARAAAGTRSTGGEAASRQELWWCCWQCIRCWTRYRRAVSIAAFTVLVAKFPHFVTLWRANIRSATVAFPNVAFQFGGGRQAAGGCLASLLLQVLGVKGKQQLETGFAAHLLPLLPGGRDAHGQAGGGGGSKGRGVGRGGEWREGLRGVEWEEYVERVGKIVSQGGLAGEQYRCCCSQCGEGEGAEGRATGAVGDQPSTSGGSGSGSSTDSNSGSSNGNDGRSDGSSSGMVISGADPTDFALKCATLFCQPLFAQSAALVFSDSAGSSFKERVEDAAVEEARNLLAAGEKGTEGSGVQDRGKRAVDSDVPRAAPASSAAGAAGATKASSSASGARLVLVNSNAVVGLFTYRVTCLLRWVRVYGFRVNSSEHCICSDRKKPAIALPHPIHDLPNLLQRFGAAPKPQAATGLEGSPATVWKEFPEGDRAAVAEHEKDTGEFMGIKILHVGAFQGGEVDREEVKKEHNVRELNLPPPGAPSTVNRNPGGEYTLQDNTSGPYFPTLSHRVEEFLRRFAPARLAREGRNGPLARAITSWAGRLGLGDRAWAALALGPFAPGRIKPILRSRIQVDILIEMIANSILPAPVCTRCDRCIGTYYLAVNLTSFVATFAYRPSSALLRCILSLFPARSARFRSFLENLGVAPLPAVVPDSLVAVLLEGVMEEHHLPLIFYGTQLILKEEGFDSILEPVGQDGGGQARGEGQQQQQQGEEEWRMWEEVDSWRMAAGNAWPALEAHGAALQRGAGRGVGGVEEEELEECCEGMRRAMRDDVAVAAARKEALIAMVIAAGDPGATGANAGTRTGEGQGGRAGSSYLEPYCPQAHVDAVAAATGGAAAPHAAAAAAPGERFGAETRKGKAEPRGCSSPQCVKVEGGCAAQGLVTASWYAPSETLTSSSGPTPVNVDLAASSDLSDSSVASTLSSSGDSAAAVAKSAKPVPAAVQAPPAPRAAAIPIAPRACPRPLVLSAYDGVLDPDLFEAAGELGRGGFGTVVAMRRVESGEVVAVKRVERKQLVAASNEAMVSASLSECPGVLGVREVHLAEQHAYMLSDVCHGGDLRALLQRRKAATSNTTGDAGRSDWRRWWGKASGEGGRGGGMAEAEALEVVKHVGDAVAFCHERGVVHCDIKPDNILFAEPTPLSAPLPFSAAAAPAAPAAPARASPAALSLSAPVSSARTSPRMAAGAVRLADFGLAQVVAEGQRGCSIPAGTPGYVAPEVEALCRPRCPPAPGAAKHARKAAGGAEVRSAEAAGYGRAADVWSLGVTLYEMIAGERPYSGKAPQQGGWRAPVDGAAWEGVSEECRALVSGMLRVRAEERLSMTHVCNHPAMIRAFGGSGGSSAGKSRSGRWW